MIMIAFVASARKGPLACAEPDTHVVETTP
jgi:hypothetical protein